MKILSIDEMLEAAHEVFPKRQYQHHVRAIEEAATQLGEALANHLNIRINGPATFESAFGGTCVTFRPKNGNQPCPDAIQHKDTSGDWE